MSVYWQSINGYYTVMKCPSRLYGSTQLRLRLGIIGNDYDRNHHTCFDIERIKMQLLTVKEEALERDWDEMDV